MAGGTRFAELRAPLRHRDFRLVWIAQIASELGDWAARLALALLVLERTDSPTLSAFSFTVSVLPTIGLGPLLATYGDRHSRRRVLVVTDLARAGLYGAMALPIPTWALFPLLFVAATATPPFEAVRSALLPTVLPEDAYGDGVVLSGITAQVALLAGYGFGGGLVGLIGARLTLVVNASSFVLSALVLTRLHAGRERPRELRSTTESFRRGLGFVTHDRFVRRAASLACAISFGAIAVEVLAPTYARNELGRAAGAAGVLAAAVPLGTIAFAAAIKPPSGRDGATRLPGLWGAVLASSAVLVFVSEPGLPVATLGFFGVGAVFGVVLQLTAVVGLAVPDDVRAAAFGVLQAAMTAAPGSRRAPGRTRRPVRRRALGVRGRLDRGRRDRGRERGELPTERRRLARGSRALNNRSTISPRGDATVCTLSAR